MAAQKSLKKERVVRTFPSAPFSDSLEFAKQVYEIGGGTKVRRLTVFDELSKSPTSSASQALLSNSAKYGLTKGSYKSEFIEITPLGIECVAEGNSKSKLQSMISAGIGNVALFNGLYEEFRDLKLPSTSVIADKAEALGVRRELANEAVDTFILNLRDVGLLKTISGAERVVTVDHRLEDASSSLAEVTSPRLEGARAVITSAHATFETTVFYVTPIGESGSVQRRHADMFAASIVEPAIAATGLTLVRADQIESPGIITKQIIEYLVHSRLVIADLSFHNPNVFYELAVRHVLRKPTVQIMRKIDKLPFDVSQNRTVIIDEEDKYDLIAKMPTFVSDLSAQVRHALDNPDAGDNPFTMAIPKESH